ncbi:hypothetical protein JCM3765_003182 [Sporobolomyces pararoseus]
MDSLSSWRNAGSGFDLSNVPAHRRPLSSSSTASTSQRSRKPTPSSTRAPTKQALLFSRDKTPLITPRESTSKPNRSTQSKLSANSIGRRTPLVEKPSNRASAISTTLGGGPSRKKKQSLELVDVDGPIDESSSDIRIQDSAKLSRSLSSASSTAPSTSKWKGKLSTSRQLPQYSTSGTSHSSIARQILNPTNPRKGPTIEFDRDDIGSDSDNEMKGETQRRKRRKIDWGGWGRLDLMNAEDAEEEEQERLIEQEKRRNGIEAYPHRGEEEIEGDDEERSTKARTSLDESQKQGQKSFVLNRLPPPRPSSRSQYRSTGSTQSSSGSVTSSAEDIQARLVPFKPAPRVLVPDSDELAPIESGEGLEEPDTEIEEDKEEEKRHELKAEKLKRPERSDDSGFVEMIDLSHSSSPNPRPLLRSTPPFNPHDNDDLESIPDSQPSVASHLSHALGSSPPRSSSSIVIIEQPSRRRLPPLLRPTESAILMPPPPAVAGPPRKRLRRGPPPRPIPPPTPSSSRVLVEDTQIFSPHRTSTSTSDKQPYRIFAEETLYSLNEEEEALRKWNELNTRLPSDLDRMRFDSDMSVRLPTPKPLRPSKELLPEQVQLESPSLSRSISTTTTNDQREEHEQAKLKDTTNLQAQAVPQTGVEGWQSLDLAWKGSLPLHPPPPPVPRQSRLTEHFSLNPSAADGELVEDSQAPAGGFEVYELERAVRDSIRYLTRKEEVPTGAGRVEVVKTEEEEKREMEEEDEIQSDCSSPLTELSPSPSPLPPHPEPQLQKAVADVQEEEAIEEVIPDSDPEDDYNSISSNNQGRTLPISPLGGKTIRSRFPRYELPKSVLEFGKDENAEMDNSSKEGGAGEGGMMEESMWESYWTLGTPNDEVEQLDGEEVVEGDRSKTVTELLLEQAPEIDLPPGWNYDDEGELVKESYEGADGEL